MGYTDRIEIYSKWNPKIYRPFLIEDRQYGLIRYDKAERLADFPKVFKVSREHISISPNLYNLELRNGAVAEVMMNLYDSGDLPYWRNEVYPVARNWGDPPALLIERGAVPWLGIRAFGVHINGIVEYEKKVHLWVGKRSLLKDVAPGKLDNLVAGGQPHGISIMDNVVKECHEEAGIPRKIALTANFCKTLSYVCEQPDGLRDDVAFCFDLRLSKEFKPVNLDGEVIEFQLLPIEKVAEIIRNTDKFKFNSALVLLDFLIRYGMLGPKTKGYKTIVQSLSNDDSRDQFKPDDILPT